MLDLSINLKMVEQNCPLTQTSSVGGARSSNNADLQPLGQLDSLPLEIFQNILEQLDLHTLILVQCLSHRSKLLVSSIPQYRDILAYAPNALRAILSTGLASHFSIETLYSALRSQVCFMCGSFGAFLYLLSCRRCYWLCLAEAPEALPVSREFVTHEFGLPGSTVRHLPCIRSLPGRYSLDHFDGDTHKRRLALISTKAAKEGEIEIQGSEEAMGTHEVDAHAAGRFAPATDRNRKTGNRTLVVYRGEG